MHKKSVPLIRQMTIMFTFLAVMMTYEGRWWNKGVFVITFNGPMSRFSTS